MACLSALIIVLFVICFLAVTFFLMLRDRRRIAKTLGGEIVGLNTIEINTGLFKLWVSIISGGGLPNSCGFLISANLGCAATIYIHNGKGFLGWPWFKRSFLPLPDNEELYQVISKAPATVVKWLQHERTMQNLVLLKEIRQSYVINKQGVRAEIVWDNLTPYAQVIGHIKALLIEFYNESEGCIYVIPLRSYHRLRYLGNLGNLLLGLLILVLLILTCNGLVYLMTR